jgi:hypothetical protein
MLYMALKNTQLRLGQQSCTVTMSIHTAAAQVRTLRGNLTITGKTHQLSSTLASKSPQRGIPQVPTSRTRRVDG